MTRNDILNSVDAEKKMELIFEKWDYCCRQQLATSRDEKERMWKELCCVKYRGNAYDPYESCRRCRAEFLNMEVEDDQCG